MWNSKNATPEDRGGRRVQKFCAITGGTALAVVAVGAWAVSPPENMTVTCSSQGTAVISGPFQNQETDSSGDMNVTLKTNYGNDGPKLVVHKGSEGSSKDFSVDTGQASIPSGTATFEATWANGREGSDSWKVSYSAHECTPPTTKIDVPAQPSVTDKCGPNNATWNVPADTETLKWTLQDNGHLVVGIKPENTQFKDDTTSHDYGVAPDSGEACPDQVLNLPEVNVTGGTCAHPTVDFSFDVTAHMTISPMSGSIKPGQSVLVTYTGDKGWIFVTGESVTTDEFTNTFDVKSCVTPPPPGHHTPPPVKHHHKQVHHTPPPARHTVGHTA